MKNKTEKKTIITEESKKKFTNAIQELIELIKHPLNGKKNEK